MAFKKIVSCFLISLVFNLGLWADASAGSLSLTCRTGGNGTRSAIKLRGTGLRGKYYAKIFSGDNFKQAEEKAVDANGVIEFKFDSDPTIIANNPGTIEIVPDFIKQKEVVGVLRRAGTFARIGGMRSRCRGIKTQ
jgi:hypothetical protein